MQKIAKYPAVLYGAETPEEELAAATLLDQLKHPHNPNKTFKAHERQGMKAPKAIEDLGDMALAAERVLQPK